VVNAPILITVNGTRKIQIEWLEAGKQKMIYQVQEGEIEANKAIAKDCAALGYHIESPWDLVGNQPKYEWTRPMAEIFAKHLRLPHPPRVLEGLMFAGSWLETKDLFFEPILAILRKNGNNYLGQSAVNALFKMVENSDVDLLRDLFMNKAIGESRALIVEGYAKLAKKGAIETLRAYVSDPVVRSEALKALSQLGDQSIRGELHELLKHTDSYHRKIARDALARLDRKAEKTKKLN
jgi:HEAT repeats